MLDMLGRFSANVTSCLLSCIPNPVGANFSEQRQNDFEKNIISPLRAWALISSIVNVRKFCTLYFILFCLNFALYAEVSENKTWNGQQCRP